MIRVRPNPGHLMSADAAWRGVSVKKPCPVCGGSDGCFIHEEDVFASCGQHPSDWPLTNGTWLHRIAPPMRKLAVPC